MIETDIGFIVRSDSDEAFELLDFADQLRVHEGHSIVIENSGITRIFEPKSEELGTTLIEGAETTIEPRVIIRSGTFKHIQEDMEVPFIPVEIDGQSIRLIDLSGTDPKLLGLGRKLNGNSSKAKSLAVNSIRVGLTEGGIIPGARVIIDRQSKSPIFAVQSGGSDDSKRVSAALTIPESGSRDAYLWGTFMYSDLRKAAGRIEQIL